MTSEVLETSEIRFGSKIGHFVVDGELGAGGMGVVYAAHDRELDRHVALKVLRGAIDEESRMRLLREGQAMARITHPNVITVYEVGVEGRMVFLAQELLDGGSLREWLEKPRSHRDIVDKFVAAGRGLAAAHAAGLVHRDFKPDNVLLGRDGRVRVSDFGLARSLGALETMKDPSRIDAMAKTDGDIMRSPMAPMTRTGAVMGTPLYMSPEQHRGEPTDERSDQFSFCVALYESLYGAVPFPGKTAVALADAVIAGRMQPPPRQAKVSARVRKILLRGLATNPKHRYPSMDALIADLLHDPGRKVRSAAIYAGIAVLVLGALVGGYVISQRRAATAPPAQRVIAVLGFKNVSADRSIDWISSGLSELLATELAQGDSVRVIPAEDTTRARIDLALPNDESFSAETLQRIQDRLQCNAVLVGSYLKEASGAITLIVTVEDLHAHKNSRIEVHGTDLPPLAKEAGRRIREVLHIGTLSLAIAAHEVLPKNPEAARAYMEGVEALHKFDFATAKTRLLVAMRKDPDFAPGYIALANAHQGLFEGDAAEAAAQKALEAAKTLDVAHEQQALFVSGQAYELLDKPELAREQYRRLFAANAKLEYGIDLLRVQTPDDFAGTLAAVRRLAPEDPHVDVLEARMELDRSSPNAAHAVELAARAGKSGDVIMQAQAHRIEGEADAALGKLKDAGDAFEAARKLFETAGDRVSAIDVTELLAGASLERGLLDDAFAKYDAVAELRTKAKQPERAALAQAAAAYALAARGKINDAEKRLEEANAHKGQDPLAIPYVDLATAQIKWARGDTAAALKAADNCAARFAGHMAILCAQLSGEIHADRGEFADARKRFEDALAGAGPFPQRSDALKLDTAQLDLEEIDAQDDKADDKANAVVAAAQDVQKSATARGAPALEAQAWIAIGRAHLLQAATQKTRDDVSHALDAQPLRLRVQAQLAYAIASHHLGDDDEANAKIAAVRAEADKQTCIGLSLETRLAHAQIIAPDEGKAELEAVIRDAKARGFGRIVKLAENVPKQ